jgi:hypothetical protein
VGEIRWHGAASKLRRSFFVFCAGDAIVAVSLHVAVCSLHVLVVDQNNRIIIVLVFTRLQQLYLLDPSKYYTLTVMVEKEADEDTARKADS